MTVLAGEAQALGRHVVGSDPAPALCARYERAVDLIVAGDEDAAGRAVVAFAVRRPFTLPWLDAATALVDRDGPLRRRLVVMAAVLEACPDHAEAFLPRGDGLLRTLLALIGLGLRAGGRLLLGLAVLPLARRARP